MNDTVQGKKSAKDFLMNNILILIILGMVLVVGIKQPNFFSTNNLTNIAVNVSTRFIIALGVSGCLITKGTDLSAGRMVGLGACIAATLVQKPEAAGKFFPNLTSFPILGAILIAVLVCAFFGLLNGLIIAYLSVPPFITTLATQLIVYGACLVYTGAQPLGNFSASYLNIAKGSLFNVIPYLFLIAVIIGAFMYILYNKTPHGKYMYAIGGNPNAAEVSGVNVKRTTISIYVLAGVLYAIAGCLLASKAGGATVNTGQGYELEAIAACTIGGVSTNGGVGKVSGVLIGVLVFELLKSGMQFLGIDTSFQYIVQGIVIAVAVALDLRKYLQKK